MTEIINYGSIQLPSWKTIKRDLLFPSMAKFIGTKDKRQVKSFDQRMKKKYLRQNIDIVDFTLKEIKVMAERDPESDVLLHKYRVKLIEGPSNHMELLKEQNEIAKKLNKDIDKLYRLFKDSK